MVTTHNCRVQRECREELNVGPECPSTSMSLLMRINSSESGALQRCSPQLAAGLMGGTVGLPAGFHTHHVRRKHSHYPPSHLSLKGTIFRILEHLEPLTRV